MMYAQTMDVSLNSVVGLTLPKTMKMTGDINGLVVVVLVDNGASHKFYYQRGCPEIKSFNYSDKSLRVQMGSGQAIPSK